jgi:hypothetical protein
MVLHNYPTPEDLVPELLADLVGGFGDVDAVEEGVAVVVHDHCSLRC